MIKDLFEFVETPKSYDPKYRLGTESAGLNDPYPKPGDTEVLSHYFVVVAL